MKLTISKRDFQEALRKVLSEKKSTLPILTNFMLRAEDGKLSIYGTDLEVYSTYTIPANVIEDGEICVNSKKLIDISKVLPTLDITLEKQDNTLKIIAGKTKYSLPTIDTDDFPTFDSFPEDISIKTVAGQLLKGLNKTSHAASKDESRFTLNGICFSFTNDRLELAATDGHRLAIYKIDYQGKMEGKYIVPIKAIAELKKLLPNAIDVDIAAVGSNMFFKSSEWTLQTRLLDGYFPDYAAVIPNSYEIQIVLSKDEFLEALKRVTIAIEEAAKPIKIELTKGSMKISSVSEGSFAEDILDVDYDLEDFEIGFNGNYLIEAVAEVDTSEVVIEFTGKDSQTVIKPSKDTQDYLAVVMPMSV